MFSQSMHLRCCHLANRNRVAWAGDSNSVFYQITLDLMDVCFCSLHLLFFVFSFNPWVAIKWLLFEWVNHDGLQTD